MTAPRQTTVGDVAALVRSKNAGPFWLTLDIFCTTGEAYQALAAVDVLTPARIADLYKADPATIRIFRLPQLRALKISLPRSLTQGAVGDRDIHAGQQHVPLSQLTLE
jgi:uncharacterized protein DUF4387